MKKACMNSQKWPPDGFISNCSWSLPLVARSNGTRVALTATCPVRFYVCLPFDSKQCCAVADPEGGGGGVRPPPKITLRYDKIQATLRNRSKSRELCIAQKWQTTF